jgi:hypothetical protein
MTSGKRDALGPLAVMGFGVGAGAGFGIGTVVGFSSAKPAPIVIAVWMKEIPMLARNARRFIATPPVTRLHEGLHSTLTLTSTYPVSLVSS